MPLAYGQLPTAVGAPATAGRIFLERCIVPLTGRLRDICIFIGSVANGNMMFGVYDVGDAAAGVVTKLWDSGVVANGSLNQWRAFDPNLAVTSGQHIQLAFVCDSTNATFGRNTAGNSPNPWGSLPAGWLPTPNGVAAKPVGMWSSGVLDLPPTIADTNIINTGTAVVPFVMARVS